MTTIRSAVSRVVLMDTGAYYALTNPQDRHHPAARIIQRRLVTESRRVFTTNFIAAETHALALSRLGREAAARLLAEIDASTTTIIRISESDEQRGREIIYRYRDKNFSLTDATSFAVMERLGIVTAFTFDRNFSQYGLQVLTP